jgi:hypothetical protein
MQSQLIHRKLRLQAAPSWFPLFGTPAEPHQTRTFITLSRHGEEFLFLPTNRRAALHALQLYPAQTPKARAARAIVQSLIEFGLKGFLSKRSLSLATNSPFATFLQSLAHASTLPDFAVLVGNPHAPGARFIFLVFDSATQPVGVVKAGLSPEARELVRREYRFLCDNSPQFPGLPAPLGFSEEPDHTALALPYIEGRSPAADDATHAATLLSSWRTDTDPVPLGALPAWQALDTTDPIFQSLPQDLPTLKVHPVLMHGDFAPWNIRVGPHGTWTAFDWERGQFPGVPSWDWFHYVVQTSILVRHDSPHQTLLRLQRLFTTLPFQSYAQQAGIADGLLGILAGYLLHNKMHGLSGDAESIDQISRLVVQELGN